jgi:hypothetical protein
MEQDSSVEIWHKPMKPAAELIDKIQKEIENPPEEIVINIKLTGIGAKRYYFVSKILQEGFDETSEDIAKYLIRLGVEQEITKITAAMHCVDGK